MQLRKIPIDQVQEDPANVRSHSERNVEDNLGSETPWLLPVFAVNHSAHVSLANPESRSDVALRLAGSDQGPDLARVGITELRQRMGLALVPSGGCVPVFAVDGQRVPHEIFKSVVPGYAVEMPALKPLGARTAECLQHESVHPSRVGLPVAAQLDVVMTASAWYCAQPSPRPGIPSQIIPAGPHVPAIVNGISGEVVNRSSHARLG